jgi:hypothetical protein
VIFQTKYQIKNAIYAKLKKVILLHINQMWSLNSNHRWFNIKYETKMNRLMS